jgi:uncharacterized protein
MPKLDREPLAAGPTVTGFAGTGFRVNDHVFPDGLILTPEKASPWDAPAIDGLTAESLGDLLATAPIPEFLLLGTGAATRRPPAAFTAALEARGIGVEAMDSRAAARAWGVLRQEDRWIVAALLPLG